MPRQAGLSDPLPLIAVAAGILEDAAGRVLIARRADRAHAGGCWEFPGGKLHAGESAADALARELREELGIEVLAATPFMVHRHDYPERRVELHVFRVPAWDGEPRGLEGQPLRWVEAGELAGCGLLEADAPIAEALISSR